MNLPAKSIDNPADIVPNSGIGVRSVSQISILKAACSDFSASTEAQYDHLFTPALKKLDEAVVSVSVIGQVKAGKTSLLNSFMGKPGFLPSDVNPWTAVITSLFLGKPGGPEFGAKFSFFDDAQWKQFSSREGRFAELAGSIPGGSYDFSEIEDEVARMRERAVNRLGQQFHLLLGKSHEFATINSEVLSRYICAGDDPEGRLKSPEAGRLADITRRADVYLDKGRFEFPLELVDTPGLNDPLLIREEMTLQSLEKSNIHILVLSAHQAFTSTDLYLLRVLNALRLDRLIVFVNRVDELTSPENDVPDIRSHVQSMLDREGVGAEIPIIFGSAVWAEAALSGNSEGANDARDYFVDQAKEQFSGETKVSFEDAEREASWVASGIWHLDQAVAGMLESTAKDSWIKSATIDVSNAIQIAKTDMNTSLGILKQRLDRLQGKMPAQIGQISQGQDGRTEIVDQINTLFQKFRQRLDQVSNREWMHLKKAIHQCTEDFIVDETQRYEQAQEDTGKRGKKSWTCDPEPLRRLLANVFKQEFLVSQTKLLSTMEKEAKTLIDGLVAAGLDEAAGIQVNLAALQDIAPSTTVLSKAVSFDLSSSYWEGWMSRFKSGDSISKRLGKMIRSQFIPIESALVESITKKFIEATDTAIGNFQTVQESLLNSGQSRLDSEDTGIETMDADTIKISMVQLQERLKDCDFAIRRVASVSGGVT